MKRTSVTFIFAAAALLLALTLCGASTPHAYAAGTYAYLPADTPLYFASEDGYEVKVNLPSTYFVSVLSESGYYYRVGYGDISGYVRQTSVQPVDYEPASKHALGTGKLKSGIASVYLFEKADLTAKVATVNTDTIIETYGSMSAGQTVYYCRIVANGIFYYGYLSETVADFTMPPENNVSAVATPGPETPSDPGDKPSDLGDLPVQVILVLCLVIPSIVVVMLLFTDKNKKKKKKL